MCFFIDGQSSYSQNYVSTPYLKKQGTAVQLIVHGKPFLILGGELGNSSPSNMEYMANIWQKLKTMRLNTILVPVYWELIEPQEGCYDFTLVDSIIYQARRNDFKIVPLWFGSWKNSMSCYTPYWVKTNQKRFPRSRTSDGKSAEILTPFSNENRNADAKAFAEFMKHLRIVDEKENTAVIIQVENEIGMIPDARDYCAEAAFGSEVPVELMTYLQKNKDFLTEELLSAWNNSGMKTSGTWEEIFGKGLQTDEIFMAWYFSTYTNLAAEAGKKEYQLPMFVNAALIRPNSKPGQYPSAGPLPHLFDIWHAGAPKIDILAPDIYFKNFSDWIGRYDRSGNPIFIPEADRNQSITNAFFAFARHNAIGYSPFSIENSANPESNQFNRGYNILEQLAPLILEHQGRRTMTGFLLDSAEQTAQVTMGEYIFNIKHEYTWPYAERLDNEKSRFGGMIIKVKEDEFYIAGSGIIITFQSSSNDGTIAGIACIDEGAFKDGNWIAGRRLNGDESHQGRHMYLPGKEFGIQKVKLYKYK